MRVIPEGVSPFQPGGVMRKFPACVPVVRQPGEAKTSVQCRASAEDSNGRRCRAPTRSSAPWSSPAMHWNKACRSWAAQPLDLQLWDMLERLQTCSLAHRNLYPVLYSLAACAL